MFFQFTSKQSSTANEKTADLYDQLQFVVTVLLKREVPSSNTIHHLLYNANSKLEELRQAISYHREHINLECTVGMFHKNAYEQTINNYNKLQLLIDSYISLNIEADRTRINHRYQMRNNQIEYLYSEVKEFLKYPTLSTLENNFYNALKGDLMPILAELR